MKTILFQILIGFTFLSPALGEEHISAGERSLDVNAMILTENFFNEENRNSADEKRQISSNNLLANLDEDNLLDGFDENSEVTDENELLGFDEDTATDEDELLGFDNNSEVTNEDELLDFDDEDQQESDSPSTSDDTTAPLLRGSFGLRFAYAHASESEEETGMPDWSGLRKAQSVLRLNFDWNNDSFRIYIGGKVAYDSVPNPLNDDSVDTLPQPFMDEYQKQRKSTVSESEFEEVYLSFSPVSWIDLQVGRQIVTWGSLDSLSVLNVINPIDMREPGMTEVEDARLPVTLERIALYFGDFKLQGLIINEIRFNKEPGYGSEYFLYPDPENFTSNMNRLGLLEEEIPSHGGENTEYAVSLGGDFSGWDMTLYKAEFFNDSARFSDSVVNPITRTIQPTKRVHDRLNLIGMSFSAATGEIVWKGEAGKFSGYQFLGSDQEYSNYQAGIGIDYSGITNTSLIFETSSKLWLDFDELPQNSTTENIDEQDITSSIVLRRDFLNQTLKVNFIRQFYGQSGESGAIQRFSLDYAISDSMSVEGGSIAYISGTSRIFQQYDQNDRLFTNLTYSF